VVITQNLHSVAGTVVLFLLNDFPPTRTTFRAASTCATVLLGATLNAPIENVVVLIALANEKITEKLAKVRVVGLVVETKGAGVIEEDSKFVGIASAEEIGGGGHFLLHDAIIFLLLSSSLEPLPRKGTAEEVHEHVSQGFEIIATSLFDAQMGVDGCVPRRSGQVLIFPVRDVKMGFRVPEFLRETEIDDVDLITTFADSHEEVVGLDVPVNEVSRMDVLDTGDL
jgi:hypothetical protein